MADRLSTLDTSFLHMEDQATPLHVGSVMVFDVPDEGFDYERLVALVAARIAFVPRYRQRVRTIPGNIANPVWVDDERFDVTYHVRRSALPRPGTDEQLEELVARIMPRALDRDRPLWEVYLVEGLADNRFAIVTKAHQALVDGVHAIDLGQVILDGVPTDEAQPDTWRPGRSPSDTELVVGAVADMVRTPTQIFENLHSGLTDMRHTAARALAAAADVVSTLARVSTHPAPVSALNAKVGGARHFIMVGTDLEDYRTVRSRLARGNFAEEVTVHDVILATITGAMRSWMLTRGESVSAGTTVRAMVPVSVIDEISGEGGRELQACFIDLPLGEPGPSMRLHQVAFAMRQQMDSGRPSSAQAIASISGFAPPSMHAMGARLAGAVSRRLYNLAITNVPGPQRPLYAAGAQLLASYPVMPLHTGQALSIGLTSYDGGVYYGVYADRDAVPDADVFGQAIVESLQELLDAPRPKRRR